MDLYYHYDVRNDVATKIFELVPDTLTAKFNLTLKPDMYGNAFILFLGSNHKVIFFHKILHLNMP